MKVRHLLGGFWLWITLLSCEHKELCYDHPAHSPNTWVHIAAEYVREWQYKQEGGPDWENDPIWQETFGFPYSGLKPSAPDGMRIHAYPLNRSESDGNSNTDNLPSKGGDTSFGEGEYQLLFHNNDTEYIVFRQMESYPEANATTRTTIQGSYTESGGGKIPMVNQPDLLFVGHTDRYVSGLKLGVDTLSVTLRPLVFTYIVFFEITNGLEHISLARATLAGMAGSVNLHNGKRSAERVAILFDCEKSDEGLMAVVRSFGTPKLPEGEAGCHTLALELKFKNGKRMSRTFDLSDQITGQPCGGVIGILGIEIPDEMTEGPDSGFDVDIDDWGDYEHIEIPI